jgi:ABC-type nitrate/sulfonate/bicarbonate transport system permease component
MRKWVGLLLAIIVWQVLSTWFFDPKLVPSPIAVSVVAYRMIITLDLIKHMMVTLSRVTVGFSIGSAIGIVLGLFMGRIRLVRAFFDVPLAFVRGIPPIAVVPIAIIWFGIGEMTKYFLIMYPTAIIVALNTCTGVGQISVIRVRAARCFGVSERSMFWRIILPSAIPFVLTGLRLSLGLSFLSVIAAELIAANAGLGHVIMDARMLLQTERMFVGIITIGSLGVLSVALFNRVLSFTKISTRFRD